MYYKNIKDYERLVDSSCFNTNEEPAIDIYAALFTLRKGLTYTLMLGQQSLLRALTAFRI